MSDGLHARPDGVGRGALRAHVGGRSAPVGVLAEIGETLVAVHGQSDQWRLRQRDQHRVVLDGFGGADVTGSADYAGRLRRAPPA